ncbi:hypothetical protein CABS01_13287, partial [Colletotrichum abscissum]|uniref:uncharacterized protein n=1 Tax=Colletotrichum abscissum TaxID=1671311 RepID=UPI0027D5A3A4
LTFIPGLIQESLTGLWRIPWALSLGALHGKRDKILPRGEDRFKLRVHFTVALLRQNSNCRVTKRYLYVDGKARWEAKKDHNVVLEEATILGDEHRLFRMWIELSEGFARLAKDDPGDADVNWTQVARGLNWTEPDGRTEAGALIAKISGKLGANSPDLAIDSDSVNQWKREKSRAIVVNRRSDSRREDLERIYI